MFRTSPGRWFVIAILVFLTLSSGFTQEKRPMTFVDVVNTKRISNPRLSPDGEQLLFVKTVADWDENKTISHLWRIGIDGSGLVQMTNGEEGERGGNWSPSGNTIAFIANRSEDPQIYFINNMGGEAIEFTNHAGGVRSFQWGPYDSDLYFSATDPKSDEQKAREKKKDDAFIFEQTDRNVHLWHIDVRSKLKKRLTEGDFTVRAFRVSRDGKKLVYTRAPSPLYDDVLNAEIVVMDLHDGSQKQLTDNHIYESNIELSPDNQKVLFVADSDAQLSGHYYQGNLFVVPVDGGNPEAILSDFKYEVTDATWSSDGRSILFRANMGVRVELFSFQLKNQRVSQLTDGFHTITETHYNSSLNQIAYAVSTPSIPTTLWIASMKDFTPRQVFDPYPEMADFQLGRVETVRWTSTDGETVEGILTYPVEHEEGKRFPLLVHTHGGPASSDKLYFDGYAHARAGRGYAVLKPNYRGSTGYGNAFLRDMVGHYFLHADDDVLMGVDYLIEIGIADPDRLGTLGWSAGGHMTNWLITETDRFRAASSGAGASNWISMYAQSDVRIYRTPWFLGDPWHADSPLETYHAHSPIFRIHHAKTPTLILFGENDKRVPMPQGVEMYRGLKANGVPTELIVFPRSGHGPRELMHRLYKMNKEFQWLDHYIMEREFEFDAAPVAEEEE